MKHMRHHRHALHHHTRPRIVILAKAGMWMPIIWTAVFLFLVVREAVGQENPLRTPAIPFVDLNANKLVFAGDHAAWDRYHTKLDKLLLDGSGQVNIVHVGGSHIQADMWSMELRSRLQTVVPGVRGGRGFIFPYNMAKTNNPYWYNPEYTGSWTSVKNTVRVDSTSLGLAGYSVTTRDSLTTLKVSFRGEVYAGYSFNRIKVLHRMDSSFTVTAWSPDRAVQIERQINAAKGYTEFEYDRYVDTLYLQFRRTDHRNATSHCMASPWKAMIPASSTMPRA
jgi:hypothetical protein